MINKQLMGWVVAGVLAAALGGVLVYETVSGEGEGRSAALGGSERGQDPPPQVAEEVNRILEEKSKGEKGKPPQVGQGLNQGKQPTRLQGEPENTCDPSLSANVFPEWRNQPENLNQARAQANRVVVGTVTGVAQGQAIVTNAPGEPGGKVETPVQTVTIKVDEALKGPDRAGGVVTIEKLGDAAGCYRVAGDPPYRQGEQYLLLLENGQGGRQAPHTISPAGRYLVAADNVLRAMESSPVAAEVAGQRLEQVAQRLRG